MAERGGLNLTWYQVILICVMILGTFYGSLTVADTQQKEAIKSVAKEIEAGNEKRDKAILCRLETEDFISYKIGHNEDYKSLVKKVDDLAKQALEAKIEMIDRVNSSEKAILKEIANIKQ